jgi:hypothetical protein
MTENGKNIVTEAYGDTLPGVPATTDVHFRSGAVAFAYIGNLLMQFVDDRTATLNDTIDRWMPSCHRPPTRSPC